MTRVHLEGKDHPVYLVTRALLANRETLASRVTKDPEAVGDPVDPKDPRVREETVASVERQEKPVNRDLQENRAKVEQEERGDQGQVILFFSVH